MLRLCLRYHFCFQMIMITLVYLEGDLSGRVLPFGLCMDRQYTTHDCGILRADILMYP